MGEFLAANYTNFHEFILDRIDKIFQDEQVINRMIY